MDRPRKIFYGWMVVAAAAVGLFFGGPPIVVFSFSVFLKPLSQEFHVGRGAISLAFTIHNFIGALCSPFIGWLVDRYGARKVAVPGLALLGLVLISALKIGSNLSQLYVFYLLTGLIGPATAPVAYSAVISRWFDRRRGLALGLIMTGMGVATVVVPPVLQRLIATFGWRTAYAVAGCAMLLIPTVIVAAFLQEDPAQKGLLPDGKEPLSTATIACETAPGMEWPQVWRTRLFWLLIAAFCLTGASVHACITHMAALLNDRGLTAHQAALGSSIVGLAIIVARLSSGYLQDRLFAPRVAMAIFGLSALGMAMLWTGSGGPVALTAAFLVGLGIGAETDIIAFIMSRYFGLRALGTAFGFAFGSYVFAGGIGGLLMGAGFDRTGSYALPLAGFFMATAIAVVIFTRLGPYRYGAGQSPKAALAYGIRGADSSSSAG
jgi:MFS family permease